MNSIKAGNGRSRLALRAVIVVAVLVALLGALSLGAQTTATIRGKVTNASGEPIKGADIVATNVATGFTKVTSSQDGGNFVMPGITPGRYTVLIVAPGYKETTEEKTILVGQTIDLVYKLSPSTVVTESITVSGDTFVETRTPELATNVTRQQIENLPQNSRNFLNFAALAPGVRLSTDENNQFIRGGALTAQSTNVFIDGVSFKNDITQGGVTGQDSSRGNPFPQSAVQEFRVITQNYSAEYQKASSAIITTITRSGTNQFSGDAFWYYQDKSLVDNDPFAEDRGEPKPAYERSQWGIDFGGPVIKDKLHFFGTWEQNDQDRQNRVTLGSGFANLAPQFTQYEGNFTSPFREKLAFGKLSWQPTQSQMVDWSGNYRHETDISGFGGQTAYDAAENKEQDIYGTTVRHQLTADTWLNEATVSYQKSEWNPHPLSTDVGLEYRGLIRIGGRDTTQDIDQKRFELRDAATFTNINWMGQHTVKVGGTVDFMDYHVIKYVNGNPLYTFIEQVSSEFPAEARYGIGNPDLSSSNNQYGAFVTDNWVVNNKLNVNVGLRWDYETNMLDKGYVTPAAIRTGFAPYVDPKYFSDGNDRNSPKDLFAPRLGFSYDVMGNTKTTVFGGWGKYYDRVGYNDILDERFRLQYTVGTFRFSSDGLPRDGFPTVKWDPSYLTPEGLQQVLATGQTGNPEVFLIANDTKTPYSDQWNIGVRQDIAGYMFGSLSYANIKSYHGFSYIFGNRRPDGSCCVQLVPGYSNLLLSTDDKQTWYDAVYLTLDKPYTAQHKYGFNISYTYSHAKQNGGDLFSLDYPTIADYPKYNIPDVDERNRVVANGMVGIPWDMMLSAILNYGSGTAYNLYDGSGPQFLIRWGEGTGRSYTTIDLSLRKDFRFGATQRVGVIGEAFNVTGEKRYSCYNSYIPPGGDPNLGKPNCILSGTQRRFQVGLQYSF